MVRYFQKCIKYKKSNISPSINTRNMIIPPFNAPQLGDSNELLIIALRSLDGEIFSFLSFFKFWNFDTETSFKGSDSDQIRSDQIQISSDQIQISSGQIQIRSDRIRSDSDQIRSVRIRFRSDQIWFETDLIQIRSDLI